MLPPIVRYGLVSLLANGSGLAGVWTALSVNFSVEIGTALGFVIAIFIAHHFNRNWTFRDKGTYVASLSRYYASNLVLLAIQMILTSVLVRGFGFPAFATACAVLLVLGVMGYVAVRWFAFWEREETKE